MLLPSLRGALATKRSRLRVRRWTASSPSAPRNYANSICSRGAFASELCQRLALVNIEGAKAGCRSTGEHGECEPELQFSQNEIQWLWIRLAVGLARTTAEWLLLGVGSAETTAERPAPP